MNFKNLTLKKILKFIKIKDKSEKIYIFKGVPMRSELGKNKS